MAVLDPLILRAEVQNAASKELQTIKKDIDGVGTSSKKVNNATGALTGGFKALGLAAAGAFSVGKVAAYLKEASDAAIKLDTSLQALRITTNRLSDSLLNNLRTASRGTVSDLNLILSTNRALAFEIDQNKLPELMEAASARARLMGITVTQAFDDIVTGIARGSPLILDNLGIKGISGAMEEYAKRMGTTVDAMDDFEKQTALMNLVIEKSKDVVALANAVGETQADVVERQVAEIDNLKLKLGQLVPVSELWNQTMTVGLQSILGFVTFFNKYDEAAERGNAQAKLWADEQKILNTAFADGVLSLDEANFLIERNSLLIDDNLNVLQKFYNTWQELGDTVSLGFDVSELDPLRKQIDSFVDTILSLEGLTAGVEAKEIDFVINFLDGQTGATTSIAELDERLARVGGNAKDFLASQNINLSEGQTKIGTDFVKRTLQENKESLANTEKEKKLIDEITGLRSKQQIATDLISKAEETTAQSLVRSKENLSALFEDVELRGSGLLEFAEKRRDLEVETALALERQSRATLAIEASKNRQANKNAGDGNR